MMQRITQRQPGISWPAFAPSRSFGHLIGVCYRGLVKTCEHYYQRASQRRALANLDDHLLRDIGVSRGEAQREARKPFWLS